MTESEAEREGEKFFFLFTGVRPDRKLFLSCFNRTKNREILIVALAKKSLRCRPHIFPLPLLHTFHSHPSLIFIIVCVRVCVRAHLSISSLITVAL